MQINKLKAKMTERGYTQKRLASNMGISIQTLNSKINGKATFSLDEAVLLTKILSIENPLEIFFESSSQKCNKRN
ncbi:helix-turn-helix transcriptional regulator [Clostridium algidicarnis]|uniref:helix-turn-helix transcriptional regulator n=1 Tax=Clostridium algidicarnis TaxID=37659 RepID=UPI0016272F35|nr:helix-turn-helix transcriptional regulator [Clostridium algidicarnis]MBB6696277.1 helix-turn-helix transcriptional regulator [Clostridium algidicarnis]MBU3193496.1 helix-turn-helix transcriptional regulator [Clostridium algidicarnis]MBU3203098.1 helix-turn-helix transcriptional regulator [Clostridium algidicarnis]MBU3211252.1 helix-turn-helix transcriptional regulator [Clostridium algidicarnis]MBU3222240.1 helix-turn-helix transcriptional regulator [Clostridium algidicarnis]